MNSLIFQFPSFSPMILALLHNPKLKFIPPLGINSRLGRQQVVLRRTWSPLQAPIPPIFTTTIYITGLLTLFRMGK